MPSMGASVEDAKNIFNLFYKSKIRIIINESGFEFNPKLIPKERLTLVIEPLPGNVYKVKNYDYSSRFISPFNDEQLLTIESIAFYICVIVEQIHIFSKRSIKNVINERSQLIKDISGNYDPNLLLNIPAIFLQ